MAHLIGTVSLNKNVYSLYDIANFEHISKEKITELMQNCLKRTQNAAPDKSASGVQSFFNSIGNADSTINTFFTHTRLRPFAGAIRLELEKTYRNKKDIYYSMFCVSKDVYHKWKRNGKEYNYGSLGRNCFFRSAKGLYICAPLKTFSQNFKRDGRVRYKSHDGKTCARHRLRGGLYGSKG